MTYVSPLAPPIAGPSLMDTLNPNALTAEGLMLYLETRLNSLDDQINGVFAKQKNIEAVRKELMNLQKALNDMDDTKGVHGTKHDWKGWIGFSDGAPVPIPEGIDANEKSIMTALAEIDKLDPALGKEVRKSLSIDGGGSLYSLNGQYKGEEVKAAKETVSNVIKQLESSAQLEMIQLQSTMSARQTAIQMATNLISALHKGTDAIAANIGR